MKTAIIFLSSGVFLLVVGFVIFAINCLKTNEPVDNNKTIYSYERSWESIKDELRQRALVYHTAGMELYPDVFQDLIDQGLIPKDAKNGT